MVIESTFVYHFVDSELRVEILFEKDGASENGGVDWQLCTVVLEVEENFMQNLSAFLLFFGDKNKCLKTLLTCTIIPSLLSFEEKIYTKAVVNMSRGDGKRAFLFSWERVGKG